MTPVIRENYRIGVPEAGRYREIFNSDDLDFGGSGVVSKSQLKTEDGLWQRHEQFLELKLPPLGIKVLKKIQSKK